MALLQESCNVSLFGGVLSRLLELLVLAWFTVCHSFLYLWAFGGFGALVELSTFAFFGDFCSSLKVCNCWGYCFVDFHMENR